MAVFAALPHLWQRPFRAVFPDFAGMLTVSGRQNKGEGL